MIRIQSRKITLAETCAVIVVIYILPVILLLLDVIPFSYKFHVLVVGAVCMGMYLCWRGFSFREIGFPTSGAGRSLRDVLPLTIVMVLLIIGFSIFGSISRIPNERWPFFIFYIVISSPAQEFLFRASLYRIFQTVRLGEIAQTIASALLYSFIHIIYRDPWTLVITFCVGIVWFRLYAKSQHLLGVSLSHALLGVLTIMTGIVD